MILLWLLSVMQKGGGRRIKAWYQKYSRYINFLRRAINGISNISAPLALLSFSFLCQKPQCSAFPLTNSPHIFTILNMGSEMMLSHCQMIWDRLEELPTSGPILRHNLFFRSTQPPITFCEQHASHLGVSALFLVFSTVSAGLKPLPLRTTPGGHENTKTFLASGSTRRPDATCCNYTHNSAVLRDATYYEAARKLYSHFTIERFCLRQRASCCCPTSTITNLSANCSQTFRYRAKL